MNRRTPQKSLINNQQHKNDTSVNTHFAYLKLQLCQSAEENLKYTD